MTGWNMPPGCNVSDIPGNRPEDQAAEAFSVALDDKLAELAIVLSEAPRNALDAWLWEQIGAAYREGHNAGMVDARLDLNEGA